MFQTIRMISSSRSVKVVEGFLGIDLKRINTLVELKRIYTFRSITVWVGGEFFCLPSGILTTKLLVTFQEAIVKPRKIGLTDQELEIMKIVWERETATVREVYEELLKHRKIAYTTVLTMMGVLEQKGRLRKEAGERAYIYHPTEPQSEVVGTMVTDFIKRVFNGSAQPLLVHLAESKEIRQEHLDEISRLLKTKRGRK